MKIVFYAYFKSKVHGFRDDNERALCSEALCSKLAKLLVNLGSSDPGIELIFGLSEI